jgi:hypothetical protein
VIAAVVSISVSIGNFRLSSCYENELSVHKNYQYMYGGCFDYIFLQIIINIFFINLWCP